MNELEELLGVPPMQLPILRQLQTLNQRLWTFVTCFVQGRRINTLYECFQAFLLQEGIREFHELRMGNSFLHTEAVQTLYHGPTAMLNVSTRDILNHLRQFESMIGHDAFRNSTHIDRSEFLQYLSQQYRQPNVETLGIAIDPAGFGVYIGLLRRLSNQEMKEMKNIEQEFQKGIAEKVFELTKEKFSAENRKQALDELLKTHLSTSTSQEQEQHAGGQQWKNKRNANKSSTASLSLEMLKRVTDIDVYLDNVLRRKTANEQRNNQKQISSQEIAETDLKIRNQLTRFLMGTQKSKHHSRIKVVTWVLCGIMAKIHSLLLHDDKLPDDKTSGEGADEENEETGSKKKAAKDDEADSEDECDCCCVGKDTCKCSCTCDCHANSSDEEEEEEKFEGEEKSQSSAAKPSSKSSKSLTPVSGASPVDVAGMKQEVEQYLTTYCESNDIESLEQLLMCFISLEIHMLQAMQNADRSALELVLDLWSDAADKDEIKAKAWCQAFNRLLSVHSSGATGGDDSSDREEISKFIQQCFLASSSSSSRAPTPELTQQVAARVRHEFSFEKLQKIGAAAVDALLDEARERVQQGAEAISPSIVKYSNALLPVSEFASYDHETSTGAPSAFPGESLRVQKTEETIAALLQCPFLVDVAASTRWQQTFAPFCGSLRFFIRTHEVILLDHASSSSSSLMFLFCQNGAVLRVNEASTPSALEMLISASHEVPPPAHQVAVHLTSMLVKNGGQQNFPAQLVQAHVKTLFAVVRSTATAATQDYDKNAALERYVLEILLAVPTEFAEFVFSLLAEVAGATAPARSKFAENVWQVCNSDMERRALAAIAKSMNSGSVTWADNFEHSQDQVFEAMEIDDIVDGPASQLQTASSRGSGGKEKDSEIADRFTRAQEVLTQPSAATEALDTSSSMELVPVASPTAAPESCRQCIDTIRKEQFGIGLEIQDEATSSVLAIQQQRLERALKRLSDELYSENTHFVLELLQNADDNSYDMGIRAKGEFVLTSSNEVVFHNNERGFSSANIQAICDVGASTKSAQDSTSSIGKKGIGFKSVFKISDSPQVHSNGFHIRFHSKNEAHGGGLGYILPFWIEDQAEWQRQQGTTFVLPLNETSAQRVDEISESLMAFEPSILLFLRRIRELRIADQVHKQTLHFLKEESTRSRHQTVQLFSQIRRKGSERVSVAQQQWLVVKRTLQAPMAFASSPDQVRETEIAVALPFDLSSSASGDRPPLQQVFAYLPLRSYGFRFIVQGDFEVPSSREAIVNGSEWNQWLVSQLPGLMCQVVTCFVDELRLTKTNDDDSVVAQVAHLLSLLPFENEIQAPFRSVVLDTMREISQVPFLPAAPTEATDSLTASLELVKPVQLLDAWEAVQDDEVLSGLTRDAQLLFTTLNKKLLHFELSKAMQPQQKNQLKIEKLKASHILQLLAHSSAKNDVTWTIEMLRVLGKLWKKDRHADLLLQELRLIKCFPIQNQDAKKNKKKWVSLMDTGDALFLPAVSNGDKSSSNGDQDPSAASESFYGDLHVLDTDFATALSQFPDARAFLIAQVKVKMIEDHDLISHHILPKMEGLNSLLTSAPADGAVQLKVVGATKRYSKFLASHLLACSKCPVSAEIQVNMRIWTCTKNLVPGTTPNVFVMLPAAMSEMPVLSKWLQDKLRQSDKTSISFDLVGCEYFETESDADATANRSAAWSKLFVETLKLSMLFDVADARVVIAVKQILKWLTAEANAKTKESLSRELAGYLNKHWPATTPDAATEGDEAIVELLRKTKWLGGTDGKFHRPATLWMATTASKALFSELMVPYSTVSWTNESLAVDILRLKKTPTLEDALSVLSSLSSRKVDNELLDISAISRIYMLLAEQAPANAPAIKKAFSEQPLVFTPTDDGRPNGFVAVKDVVWSAASCNGHLIPLEQVYPKSLRQFFTEVCGVERKPSINSLCEHLEQLKTHESSTESDHEAKKHWKKEMLPILKLFAKQIKKSALSKAELRRIRKTLKATSWLPVSRSLSASDSKKLTWCSAKDEPIVPRTDAEREVQKIVIALQKERVGDSVYRIKPVKLDQELLDELDPLITLSKIRSLTAHALAEPSSWCDLISESIASLDFTDSEDSTNKKSRKMIQKLVKTLLIIWSKAFAQNPEVWKKADKQFQWKLQQSLLLPTLRDRHFMKPADVFINDQIELSRDSFAFEDASSGASHQPMLPIVSLFPWTYFTTVDTSENQSEAAQVRNFLLMFCGAKSLKVQLSYEVVVLGSAQSDSARLRSKIQQSLSVAQRLLFHQHRAIYASLPHPEIARLCCEVKCVVVEDAGGLQVVYRIGKSFSVRHTPATCFLDTTTPVLYVIRSESGSSSDELGAFYEMLMEVCRKCFGLQIAASVANLLYLASMQPSAEALEKWLVETQQLGAIDPEEAGTPWFSPEYADPHDEATAGATTSGGVDPSRKRSRSMLEDGEVKDEDDHHHHPSEKRARQSAESWSGGRQEYTGGDGGVFPPLPPSESSDPSSLHHAAAASYPPLPASYPGGFGGHQQLQHQHQPHQPGSFQPPLPPNNNDNRNQHTLHSDQVVSVGNTMTKEEREGIGRWGEEYVYKQLVESHKGNADMHVDWVNEHEESGKPYDITVSSSGKVVEYVEVKATRTMEKAVFEISMNELDQAAIHGSSYCIYRVFNAGNDALCRVIRMKNPIALVRQKKMQLALVMQ